MGPHQPYMSGSAQRAARSSSSHAASSSTAFRSSSTCPASASVCAASESCQVWHTNMRSLSRAAAKQERFGLVDSISTLAALGRQRKSACRARSSSRKPPSVSATKPPTAPTPNSSRHAAAEPASQLANTSWPGRPSITAAAYRHSLALRSSPSSCTSAAAGNACVAKLLASSSDILICCARRPPSEGTATLR